MRFRLFYSIEIIFTFKIRLAWFQTTALTLLTSSYLKVYGII